MPKVLSVKSYPHIPRMVATVVLNPQEPESVHADGKPHVGNPPPDTKPGLRPWEWCHLCRYNWQIIEKVWTGPEVPRSNDQLYAELQAHVAAAQPTMVTITALEGKTL